MTLTLQDAQHASYKIFRKINDRLLANGNKVHSPFTIVAGLLEETEEVATAVKSLEGLKPSEENITYQMLAKKLNDLLYSAFVLAEHYGVNLEETFLEHVNDSLLRFLT